MSDRQRVFFDWTLDTMLYLVVLGFFSEYTSGVSIDSFSTIFFAFLVLYGLTYVTFAVKRRVRVWFARRPAGPHRIAHCHSIWAILFFSKFIFLEVLDLVFGDAVDFRNFVWLMAVTVVVVVLGKLMELIYSESRRGARDGPAELAGRIQDRFRHSRTKDSSCDCSRS